MNLKSLTLIFALGLMAGTPLALAGGAHGASAFDLTTELEKAPVGLDVAKPRFSWKLKPEAGQKGQMQTAYRLILGTNPEQIRAGKADVFDSGKVDSDQCVMVDLLPDDLKAMTDYYWSVQVWDETGEAGPLAPPAKFDTGYLDESFWKQDGAQWIESPVARRDAASVEHWIRYSVANIKGMLGSDAKPGGPYERPRKLVTDEEVDRYADNMREMMRERIWSASLLRKEFEAEPITKARLYVSGLGYYRAYLNGQMVGERILAPSDSDFSANTYYNVYDVTEMIRDQENCLGIELANGRWYSPPGTFPQGYYKYPVVIARLELTDRSGQVRTVVTDPSWQAGEHGILRSGFWIGELFDANRYPTGWSTVAFDAEGWVPAIPAGQEPGGKLLRDPMPPERIVKYYDPVEVSEPMPGVYVYDFGRQITGRVKLKLNDLTKGQEVVLRYAEIKEGDPPEPVPSALAWYPGFNNDEQLPGMLQFKRRGSTAAQYLLYYGGKDGREGGSLNNRDFGGGHLYTDMYVARGEGVEIYEPKFTYTGFRYVEVLGLKEKPPAGAVQAFRLRTDPEFVGSLQTDNAKLNKVLAGTQASLMANYHSNFQDNPGSERNSFIINEGFNIDNSAYWFHMYPQLSKVMDGFFYRKQKYGFYPSIYTGQRHMEWFKERFFHLSSATSYPNLAAGLVGFYNDQRQGKEFALMLTDWIQELCEHTYWEHDHYKGSGAHQAEDSLGIYPREKRTRHEVMDRPFFKAAWIMFAGHKTEALLAEMGYRDEAAQVNQTLKAFNERFLNDKDLGLYNNETGLWDPGAFSRMGSDNLTLLGDLQPRQSDEKLLKRMVAEIEELGYITTGVKSAYELLSTVTTGGYPDLAAEVLEREEYPSLLYLIGHTGNTVAEGWNLLHSYAQVEGLAAIGRWYYCDLVGIRPSIAQPAFRRFVLKPHVPTQVNAFDFTYDSPRGLIQSHWVKHAGKVQWTLVVPPNAVAEVHVPTVDPLEPQEGMRFLRSEDGRRIYEIGSGEYRLSF